MNAILHTTIASVAGRLVLAASLALAGCTPLAKVTTQRPRWKPVAEAATSSEEQKLQTADRLAKADYTSALAAYLDSAEGALAALKRDPEDAVARRDYEFSLSRTVSLLRESGQTMWDRPLQVAGRTVVWQNNVAAFLQPSKFDFFPVDELKLGGRVFHTPVRRDGLGAPLVAVRREPLADFRALHLGSEHVYYGVTALARFEGTRCVLSIEDPLARETIRLGKRDFPLAGDFTTAVAMLIERDRPEKLGLVRLLRPDKYTQTTMLYRLQPFDPKRIPVVFVHGLDSTPATWMPMFTSLLADEEIRRRYQFWFFSYPSGYPFPYSASLLRQELDSIAKTFPQRQPIVLVGHSMGGLLTRLMVTDSGDHIWRDIFGTEPARTRLEPKTKSLLEDSLIFERRPEVARAVFFSTPHRGSDLSSGWIAQQVNRFVRLPGDLVVAGQGLLASDAPARAGRHLRHVPTSLDTLSPQAPFVASMNRIPLAPVPHHQVIGDRGKGNSPNSSDGVVAYWSSHLDSAHSTRIVPSGHSSHAHPEGIAELRRILQLHLASPRASD